MQKFLNFSENFPRIFREFLQNKIPKLGNYYSEIFGVFPEFIDSCSDNSIISAGSSGFGFSLSVPVFEKGNSGILPTIL